VTAALQTITSSKAPVNDLGISVALCTCDGATFLWAQLESIAKQSLLPAELVVFDDGSTDQTVAVVEEFARHAPFPVILRRNERKLGAGQNFSSAAAMCKSKLIAFSDQDDVWLSTKLQRLAELFTAQPDLLMAFSDAKLVDEELRPLNRTLFERLRFGRRRKNRFNQGSAVDLLLRENVVCGATMMWRASLMDRVLPVGEDWMHDHWLALLCLCLGRVCFVDEPLMLYRQHEKQKVGTKKKSFGDQVKNVGADISVMEKHRLKWERMLAAVERLGPEEYTERVRDRLRHAEVRCQLRSQGFGAFGVLVKEVVSGRYRRYGKGGLLSGAADIAAWARGADAPRRSDDPQSESK
jgi:glycosyltransferase involved in cell wall biosynthesis